MLKAFPTNLYNIPEKIEKDVICTVQWGPHTSKFYILFIFFFSAVSYVKNNWGADGLAANFYTSRPQPVDVP